MADPLSNGLHEKVMICHKSRLDVQFSKKTPLEMIIGQQIKKRGMIKMDLICLICLGYCRTKHWKCLICEKECKHRIGGTKVCKAEEVRKYFVNPKIENEVFGSCVNYIICSLDFRTLWTLFIAHEKDQWCHFMVRIGSPVPILFYCICFVSFYFFLFFLFFCGFYYLLKYWGKFGDT